MCVLSGLQGDPVSNKTKPNPTPNPKPTPTPNPNPKPKPKTKQNQQKESTRELASPWSSFLCRVCLHSFTRLAEHLQHAKANTLGLER